MMTTETEWRRRWKPDLQACPWQTFLVDGKTYHLKFLFTQDSYELLISDLKNFWYEELSDDALMKRVKVDIVILSWDFWVLKTLGKNPFGSYVSVFQPYLSSRLLKT